MNIKGFFPSQNSKKDIKAESNIHLRMPKWTFELLFCLYQKKKINSNILFKYIVHSLKIQRVVDSTSI